MLKIAFLKDADANPYYFNGRHLAQAAELARQCEHLIKEENLDGTVVLKGGHRNTTGYDALLTVSGSIDAETVILQLLKDEDLDDCVQIKLESNHMEDGHES